MKNEPYTITMSPADYIKEGDLLHLGYGDNAKIVRVLSVKNTTLKVKNVSWWVRFCCWLEDKMGRRLWFRF